MGRLPKQLDYKYPEEKEDGEDIEVFNKKVRDYVHDSTYWRGHGAAPQKYGQERKNPWLPHVDNIMFYL